MSIYINGFSIFVGAVIWIALSRLDKTTASLQCLAGNTDIRYINKLINICKVYLFKSLWNQRNVVTGMCYNCP